MEGFQRFHKGPSSTSAADFVCDQRMLFHLRTECGVRSIGAPAPWDANRIEGICIILNLITLQI